jgi:AhpD family alkylhydroperoxidase
VPIFEPVQESQATDEVKETYDKIKQKYGGIVPDLYKQLANSPSYLASITQHMGEVMGPGKIDEATKEVVAFVVSAVNGCDYCINAHKFGLQQAGFDDEAIAEVLAVAALWEEITRFAIGARLQWKQPA